MHFSWTRRGLHLLAISAIWLTALTPTAFAASCRFGMDEIQLRSSADASLQPACYRPAIATGRPTIVSLHQWSGTHTEVSRELFDFVQELDYGLVLPSARGPNRSPQACGSDEAVADVDDAVSFARQASGIDSPVAVLGVSGGAYLALHQLYRGNDRADYYSAWVPITDLAAWYRQTQGDRSPYAGNISACTNNLDQRELSIRSPLTYAERTPPPDVPVLVGAGINDGHDGLAVPISQSINWFNAVASQLGSTGIADDESQRLSSRVDLPSPVDGLYLDRSAGSVRFVVFDGGHEMFVPMAFGELSRVLQLLRSSVR